MKSDSMVHRANQIALFFAAYPHDEAVAGVLDHFKRFWERRMRDQIIAYVENGGQGLNELAMEADKRMPQGSRRRSLRLAAGGTAPPFNRLVGQKTHLVSCFGQNQNM